MGVIALRGVAPVSHEVLGLSSFRQGGRRGDLRPEPWQGGLRQGTRVSSPEAFGAYSIEKDEA